MNTGLYSRICSEYGIEFQRFSYGKKELRSLEGCSQSFEIPGDVNPIFDYLFIDESQDFDKNFIEMCELVTAKKYILLVIFCRIYFRMRVVLSYDTTDYVLNKVYRTDPRTLLFSRLRVWFLFDLLFKMDLEDKDWEMAGYSLENREANVS